jgi:hypothetical protein
MDTRWTLDGHIDGHIDGHTQNAVKHSILKQTEVNQLKERKHVFLYCFQSIVKFPQFLQHSECVHRCVHRVSIECPSSVHRVSTTAAADLA